MKKKLEDFTKLILAIEKIEKEFLSCPYFYAEDGKYTFERYHSEPRVDNMTNSGTVFLTRALEQLVYARMLGKDLLRMLGEVTPYENAYKGEPKTESSSKNYEGDLVDWKVIVGKVKSPEKVAALVLGYFKSSLGKAPIDTDPSGVMYDLLNYGKTFFTLLRAGRGIDSSYIAIEKEADLYYDGMLLALKKSNQNLGLTFQAIFTK